MEKKERMCFLPGVLSFQELCKSYKEIILEGGSLWDARPEQRC